MVNQILFGEHFKVLEARVKWSKIRLAHDKYEGWICNKQWSEIEKNTYEELERHDPILATELLDMVVQDTHQTVPLGSSLPFYKDHQFQIKDKTYTHQGDSTTGYHDKKMMVDNAMLYLNTPYLWGGRTPFGIDCSGFTQMIYRLHGKEMLTNKLR
jgi:hypothetical protein